jgi:hypothetical protein
MGVDWVTTSEVWLQVLVDPAKPGKRFKPMIYSVRLNRVRHHWVVNELRPRVAVPVRRVD